MPILSLGGKSALVTGGAHRIGRAIALALAAAGANVAITYRNSGSQAEETVRRIHALGVRGLAVHCDVRSEDAVRQALAAVSAHFGRLDVLVNNAAVFETEPLDRLTLEAWDRVFETNARGPFLVAREALPLLRAAHGSIVNIGSLGGLRAWTGHAHYCASKAALHMLTQTMAKSFAPDIRVNCVAPGWIDAEETGANTRSERHSQTRGEDRLSAHFAAKTPLQRNGSPDDVADAVLFFAAGSKFVTGQILAVDGGLGLL